MYFYKSLAPLHKRILTDSLTEVLQDDEVSHVFRSPSSSEVTMLMEALSDKPDKVLQLLDLALKEQAMPDYGEEKKGPLDIEAIENDVRLVGYTVPMHATTILSAASTKSCAPLTPLIIANMPMIFDVFCSNTPEASHSVAIENAMKILQAHLAVKPTECYAAIDDVLLRDPSRVKSMMVASESTFAMYYFLLTLFGINTIPAKVDGLIDITEGPGSPMQAQEGNPLEAVDLCAFWKKHAFVETGLEVVQEIVHGAPGATPCDIATGNFFQCCAEIVRAAHSTFVLGGFCDYLSSKCVEEIVRDRQLMLSQNCVVLIASCYEAFEKQQTMVRLADEECSTILTNLLTKRETFDVVFAPLRCPVRAELSQEAEAENNDGPCNLTSPELILRVQLLELIVCHISTLKPLHDYVISENLLSDLVRGIARYPSLGIEHSLINCIFVLVIKQLEDGPVEIDDDAKKLIVCRVKNSFVLKRLGDMCAVDFSEEVRDMTASIQIGSTLSGEQYSEKDSGWCDEVPKPSHRPLKRAEQTGTAALGWKTSDDENEEEGVERPEPCQEELIQSATSSESSQSKKGKGLAALSGAEKRRMLEEFEAHQGRDGGGSVHRYANDDDDGAVVGGTSTPLDDGSPQDSGWDPSLDAKDLFLDDEGNNDDDDNVQLGDEQEGSGSMLTNGMALVGASTTTVERKLSGNRLTTGNDDGPVADNDPDGPGLLAKLGSGDPPPPVEVGPPVSFDDFGEWEEAVIQDISEQTTSTPPNPPASDDEDED